MNSMKKIYLETYLPLFPGFYETIFAPDDGEENELDSMNSLRRVMNLYGEVTFDLCDWDYAGYREEVAEKCTIAVETLLKDNGLVDRINYQHIHSPREYNFANDAIYVEVGMGKEHFTRLSKFIHAHWVTFVEYIKERYTSYDGFLSSYSHDANDWAEDTQNFTVFDGNLHQFGSVLEFCCGILLREDEWEDRPDEWLRDQLVDYPSLTVLNYDDLTLYPILDGEIVIEGDVCISYNLNSLGFAFLHGYEDCHRMNRIQGDHRVTNFKGFWVKGDEVYGVNVSYPALDVGAVKLN
jgi:hypothetical protein